MVIPQRNEEPLMTGEELARRPDLHCELVDGRVVPMPMTGHVHGTIEAKLGAKLVAYADRTGRGIAMTGEVGIYIRHDPDTVRGSDALFISHERYARRGPYTFLDVAPELVVEVYSPDDRPGEAMKKIREYLAIGVDRVWYVDPRRRQVRIYRAPEQMETLGLSDVLQDEEILPGFSLPLAELFGVG
ncbi:MAG TPA: Uma2 family endonuclease [Thermoanaerobaculia bacterium]|jgi:Uma2 family endonuclease|nr:Uma2 family endonuclease [Thermoanaerobaculia bacterium]